MHLARFPRVRLGHMNTPLERLPRLTEALDGPEIWIKRDDCTGLSTGGNKTRKLEFLMADALSRNADIVLTQGADAMPVTAGLNSLNGQWVYNQHLVSAGSIIAALPPVLMFFLMQKHFIAGLTLGAVK